MQSTNRTYLSNSVDEAGAPVPPLPNLNASWCHPHSLCGCFLSAARGEPVKHKKLVNVQLGQHIWFGRILCQLLGVPSRVGAGRTPGTADFQLALWCRLVVYVVLMRSVRSPRSRQAPKFIQTSVGCLACCSLLLIAVTPFFT